MPRAATTSAPSPLPGWRHATASAGACGICQYAMLVKVVRPRHGGGIWAGGALRTACDLW